MRTIVFYISGHGFGHASREIEVINALLARQPDLRIIVRTSAARWLFERTIRGRVQFHHVEIDTGMVQIDSLHLDTAESVRRARAFMNGFDASVDREARFLADERVSLVVADIPPLGLAAAHRVGVRGVGLSNFTWDWIYSAYDGTGALVDGLAREYSKADLALRLPMHGGFASFRAIVDLPFVARRSSRPPADTRRRLDLPPDERLVLVSFGGYGLERLDGQALQRLAALDGYVVLVSGAPAVAPPPEWPATRRGSLLPFDESRMYAAGVRYEDLVRAVDVVVSKPGYGIISECVANETALLYTSRGHFIEYDALVAAMPQVLRAAFIGHDDLFAGRWVMHLDRLLEQAGPAVRPDVNGADVAAELLLRMIG